MGVVVAFQACNLLAKPRGAGKLLVGRLQLYFGDGKTLVVALKLIDLEGVSLILNKVAALLD